jgi:hypothetical protein
MNNYRKQLIVIFLIVLAPFGASTQIEITNQYGFGGDGITELDMLLLSNNEGHYVGLSSSSTDGSGNITAPAYGYSYGVLKYYNQNNELVWSRSFGGDGSEYNFRLAEVNDGLLVGLSSFSTPSGNKTEPAYGLTDGWLLKLDFDGEIVWQKSFGGNQNDVMFGLISTPDNSIYVAHRSESGATGNRTAPLKGDQDFWIVKTDADGETIWDRSYGSSGTDILFGIDQLSNGNIILSGVSIGASASFDKTESPYSAVDNWILAIDQNGDVIWDKTIGGTGVDGRGYITVVQDTIYLLASSTSGVSGLRTEPLKGSQDLWLSKLDQDGNYISTHYYGGSQTEDARGIAQIESNHLLIYAISNSDASYDKSENRRGAVDFWTLLLDLDGAIIAEKTIGGEQADDPIHAIYMNENIILAGNSFSDVSGDKTIPRFDINNQNSDVWVVALDASTLEVIEHRLPLLHAYPNPVQDFLHLDISNFNAVERLEVYNSAGILVSTQQPHQQEALVKLDFSSLAQGMYTVVIKGDSGVSMVKVVK